MTDCVPVRDPEGNTLHGHSYALSSTVTQLQDSNALSEHVLQTLGSHEAPQDALQV